LDDCKTAYGTLLENGISSNRIAIIGDSAGGGLSLATAISLRDMGKPLPSSIVCLSPWADLELTGESVTTKAQADPWLKYDSLSVQAQRYIGDSDPHNPLISPILGEFHGLPPILLQVGTSEILLDDSTRIAARAKEAGVDVTLEVWDGMWHVWQFLAGLVPESQQALNRIGAFVRKHMNLPPITSQ
jgi:acetyl esterase/lipase